MIDSAEKLRVKSNTKEENLARPPQQRYQVTGKVNIRPLKAFVTEIFPKDNPLRNALLAERDTLEIQEFLAKMETWLHLFRCFK